MLSTRKAMHFLRTGFSAARANGMDCFARLNHGRRTSSNILKQDLFHTRDRSTCSDDNFRKSIMRRGVPVTETGSLIHHNHCVAIQGITCKHSYNSIPSVIKNESSYNIVNGNMYHNNFHLCSAGFHHSNGYDKSLLQKFDFSSFHQVNNYWIGNYNNYKQFYRYTRQFSTGACSYSPDKNLEHDSKNSKQKEQKTSLGESVKDFWPKDDILFTIPNLLTSMRIVLTPVLGYLVLQHSYPLACGVFVFAGITDLLDGWIARNFAGQNSSIGSFLDPLADKFLVSVLFVTLTMVDLIPVPLTCLIIARDVCLIAAAFYVRYISLTPPVTLYKYFDATHASAQLKPMFISKLNTAVQLSLVALTLASPVLNFVDSPGLHALWYLTAALAICTRPPGSSRQPAARRIQHSGSSWQHNNGVHVDPDLSAALFPCRRHCCLSDPDKSLPDVFLRPSSGSVRMYLRYPDRISGDYSPCGYGILASRSSVRDLWLHGGCRIPGCGCRTLLE